MDLWIPCGFPLCASSEACSPALASLDRDQSKARRENKEKTESPESQLSQCNNWNFEHHAFLGPISSTPVSKTRKVSSLNCFKLWQNDTKCWHVLTMLTGTSRSKHSAVSGLRRPDWPDWPDWPNIHRSPAAPEIPRKPHAAGWTTGWTGSLLASPPNHREPKLVTRTTQAAQAAHLAMPWSRFESWRPQLKILRYFC